MASKSFSHTLQLCKDCIGILRTLSTTAQPGVKYETVQKLTKDLADLMGIEKGYKPIPKSREMLQKLIPIDQRELPPRTMKDSYVVGVIPLSTDVELQEKYISFLGQVRLARLLEDMDIFSVIVAQKHILNPRVKDGQHSPYTIVTALVDKIDYTDFIAKPFEDIRISGHVSWVGKSSMEVLVWLEQHAYGEWQRITKAACLLAIRDAVNSKGAVINPLVPETDEEKLLFAGGEKRKKARIEARKSDLTKQIPSMEEQRVVHGLFIRTVSLTDVSLKRRVLPPGCVWMDNCTLSNVIPPHPENRNLHNTVFGGFLMRQAMELSNTLGLLFTKYNPNLKSINDITFTKPVNMSSLLRMHASVVFTHMHFMQITVYAETWSVVTSKHTTTNAFHFTYQLPEILPEVFPRTYNEAMMHIDGRRHFSLAMQDTRNNDYEPIDYSKK